MARPPKTQIAIRPAIGLSRDQLMAGAGLSKQALAGLLGRAVKTITEGLEATMTVKGPMGVAVEVPDWRSRLKATQQILDLAGVIPSRNAPPPAEKPPKDEPVPDWARPLLAKDVTPKQD